MIQDWRNRVVPTLYPPRMGTPAEFLNVDLDVWSSVDPEAIAAALGPSVLLLSSDVARGKTRATFEVASVRARTLDAILRAFVKTFEAMSPAGRRILRGAERRVLDIGIRAGTAGRSFHRVVAPDLLRAIAGWNIELAITVYDADPDEPPEPPAPKRTRRSAGTRKLRRPPAEG